MKNYKHDTIKSLLSGAKSIRFDSDAMAADIIDSNDNHIHVGKDAVYIEDTDGVKHGTVKSNQHGRVLPYVADGSDRRIKIARLYKLVEYSTDYDKLVRDKMFDLVLNHIDNDHLAEKIEAQGKKNCMIGGAIHNWELCTQKENIRHGKAWSKALRLGVGKLKNLSALSPAVDEIRENCNTADDVARICNKYSITW